MDSGSLVHLRENVSLTTCLMGHPYIRAGMKCHAGSTLRIALTDKESRPGGSWIVVESARPAVSTTTETTKRLGSPGGRPGIRLPGCSFTTSMVVDARFPSTLAMRSTQSSEAARGVAWLCAGGEKPAHTRKHTTVRDFILCGDEGWT